MYILCMCVCVCIYIYIYIYIERERFVFSHQFICTMLSTNTFNIGYQSRILYNKLKLYTRTSSNTIKHTALTQFINICILLYTLCIILYSITYNNHQFKLQLTQYTNDMKYTVQQLYQNNKLFGTTNTESELHQYISTALTNTTQHNTILDQYIQQHSYHTLQSYNEHELCTQQHYITLPTANPGNDWFVGDFIESYIIALKLAIVLNRTILYDVNTQYPHEMMNYYNLFFGTTQQVHRLWRLHNCIDQITITESVSFNNINAWSDEYAYLLDTNTNAVCNTNRHDSTNQFYALRCLDHTVTFKHNLQLTSYHVNNHHLVLLAQLNPYNTQTNQLTGVTPQHIVQYSLQPSLPIRFVTKQFMSTLSYSVDILVYIQASVWHTVMPDIINRINDMIIYRGTESCIQQPIKIITVSPPLIYMQSCQLLQSNIPDNMKLLVQCTQFDGDVYINSRSKLQHELSNQLSNYQYRTQTEVNQQNRDIVSHYNRDTYQYPDDIYQSAQTTWNSLVNVLLTRFVHSHRLNSVVIVPNNESAYIKYMIAMTPDHVNIIDYNGNKIDRDVYV